MKADIFSEKSDFLLKKSQTNTLLLLYVRITFKVTTKYKSLYFKINTN